MAPGIRAKLARIGRGESPRLLDLFSGCGGLALGFVSAGCESVGGVELDEHAARSYALNFHPGRDGTPDPVQAKPKDIRKQKPFELLEQLHSKTQGIDIIVGGPPCPAYTRVGRAKLREIYRHPEAFLRDPRAKLYDHYIRYVQELQPLALVMENVPDILNWGGQNLGDLICELLDDLDYKCIYTLLNAANYGVPQTRERFFLVAIHRKARLDPRFPTPTTKVVLPPGYAGTRRFALKNILNGDLLHPVDRWYRAPPKAREDTPPCVTSEDALADLPRLDDHIRKVDRRGARRLDGNREYGTTPPSRYASLMRSWPGFVSDGRLRDHVTRCLTDRDYRIFEAMMPGEDYPKARARGLEFFGQRLEELQREGRILVANSEEYEEEKAKYVPPYDPEKFPNKWRKMSAREPARTLMAHLGKDTYSHIHYDSTQKRVISVREAARLQSFPDGFRFSGTMNPAFRQIGNSVPPLLAWAIASELLDVLGAKSRKLVPVVAGGSSSAEQTSIKVA